MSSEEKSGDMVERAASAVRAQRVTPRRTSPLGERVHIRTHGVRLTGLPSLARPSNPLAVRGLRGKQTGLSKASLKRLRNLLTGLDIPAGKAVYSVTWTVPGELIGVKAWRRLWEQMRHRLTRAGIECVWRVELQRRKQPHLHAVAWGSDDFVGGASTGATDTFCVLFFGWHDLLKKFGNWRPGAFEHSVVCVRQDRLRDHCNWYRYLAGHLAKEKRSQLGWVGRQWGRVGGAKSIEGDEMSVTRKEFYRVRRVFRRMFRMRRGLRGLYGKTDLICNPVVGKKVVDWACSLSDV